MANQSQDFSHLTKVKFTKLSESSTNKLVWFDDDKVATSNRLYKGTVNLWSFLQGVFVPRSRAVLADGIIIPANTIFTDLLNYYVMVWMIQ